MEMHTLLLIFLTLKYLYEYLYPSAKVIEFSSGRSVGSKAAVDSYKTDKYTKREGEPTYFEVF